MIMGRHHNAYRCRDSGETRQFYEGFQGPALVEAFEINVTKSGRDAKVLRSICFRDPNGHVIGIAARTGGEEESADAQHRRAAAALGHWQETRTRA